MKTGYVLIASALVIAPALAQNAARSMTQAPPTDFGVKPDAPTLPYHFGKQPVAPNGEKFGNVASVALLPNGDLVVFNRNPVIEMVEYDPTGTTVKKVFNPNIANQPHGMRVDRHGNLWVIDSYFGVIYKMEASGNVLKTFGTRGQNGPWDDAKWNGMFNQPLDIAFDKDDNFYVVQSHGGTSGGSQGKSPAGSDPRVLKFDHDGNYITSASLAHPDGLYPTLHTVMVAPNGDVWVGDRHSRKIIVLDKDLQNRHEIAVPDMPSGFFTDARGQLWMSTGRDGRVLKMGWDGTVQGYMGEIGKDLNGIGEGHFLAVSKDQKNIWVADSTQAKVLHFEHD
jgi:DNA-binding beta-propeller fold protein YncE